VAHPFLRYGLLVKGTNQSPSSEYRIQTLLTEEMPTLSLHRAPHCMEADRTFIPLQERMDKHRLVLWHLSVHHCFVRL